MTCSPTVAFVRAERERHFECVPLRPGQLGEHACNVVRERSPSAANENASPRRRLAASTWYSRSRPSSMPARHKVVFPIPAAPSSQSASGRRIEEIVDPSELRFAADDILEREASFPDCGQRLPPFPERTLDG